MPLPLEAREAVRRELDMKDTAALVEAGGAAYVPLIFAAGPLDEALAELGQIDGGGALASRMDGLRQVAASVSDEARLTLDPTERHGFEYQSWFGFTIYAEGARRALGRGGTYTIAGSQERATGFTLYAEALLEALGLAQERRECVFLPLGHDRAAAKTLREEGWRTIAALSEADDPHTLGCTHILHDGQPRPL